MAPRSGSVGDVLVAAALVPETALLVPGGAGRADVLAAERAAVLRAVAQLVAAAPDRVLLVVAAPRFLGAPVAGGAPAATLPGDRQVTLGGAGVADGTLGWAYPAPGQPRAASDRGGGGTPAGSDPARSGPQGQATVATTVGRLALVAGGWTGPVDVEGAAGDVATAVAASDRTALLLVGSLSARRGPDGPLPDDARAPDVERSLVADLIDLGPDARRRLAEVPAALADELAISARPLWQHLIAVVERDGRRWHGELHSLSAPFGATYAVLTWTPEQHP